MKYSIGLLNYNNRLISIIEFSKRDSESCFIDTVYPYERRTMNPLNYLYFESISPRSKLRRKVRGNS